jgi:hypothetical protein
MILKILPTLALLYTSLPFSPSQAHGATIPESHPQFHQEIVSGIPFCIPGQPTGLLTENGTVSLSARNLKAVRALVLGLTNSIDNGGRGLAPTAQRNGRFFLGTQIGSLAIVYADGTRQRVPLIFGFNVWWYQQMSVDGYVRPFDEPGPARKLEGALHLIQTGRAPPEAFVMSVLLQDKPLEKIVLEDNPAKTGFPLISAVTLETVNGTWWGLRADSDPTALHAPQLTKDLSHRLQIHSVDPRTAAADAQRSVKSLQEILYTSSEELDHTKHLPLDIPTAYHGPHVQFTGGVCADIFTNVFYHNVNDLLDKTADGTYHTSTQGSPNWGRFLGFGTWKENLGLYYPTAWSRDFGCSLIELAELGYQARAEKLSEWAWNCADWYTEHGIKYPDGTPVPPHWTRKINAPLDNATGSPPEGPQENDGHGLLMLATYKTWQRCEDRAAWARQHWRQINSAAEWICWQFEHPKLSGATDVLHTDSEAAGFNANTKGVGQSPLADFVCAQGLRAYAEIADAIGETQSANRWRQRASQMEQAILKIYVRDDPQYGQVWESPLTWGGHYAMLGPILALPDYQGMDTTTINANCRQIDLSSFLWQLHEHAGQPWPFHAETMGYGQGWMSQSALILDRIDEATQLVDWLARFAYYPRYKSYIIPEGVAWTDDAKYWHRLGDLGNGVQQAAAITVARLIIGVDDCRLEHLRILPRLPLGWTEAKVSNYPACTNRGILQLKMDYRIHNPGQISCNLEFSQPPQSFAVRLGPYDVKAAAHDLIVKINGQSIPFTMVQSGDHQWIWANNLKGGRSWTITSQRRGI